MWTRDELEQAMEHSIKIADKARTPFASLLLDQRGDIVLEAVNTSKKDGPLAHAEMNLLHHAIKLKLPLNEMCLVSTCEPCPMCMAAMIWSKLSHCAYAVSIDKASDYLNQIHISAEEIARSGFAEVHLIKDVLTNNALALFEEYARS